MARTDILLDPDTIDAITADGSFTLSRSASDDPDIRLTPHRASLQLGGGGDGSDGQATLRAADGAPRITLRADSMGLLNDDENVLSLGVQNEAGRLSIARISNEPDAPRQRETTVELDGDMGQINLGSDVQPGRIYIGGGRRGPQSAIALNGNEATITVGGSPGIEPGHSIREKAGRIVLVDTANTETVTIEGETEGENRGSLISLSSLYGGVSIQSAGGAQGGKIELMTSRESAAVTIDGGTGTLVLGQGMPSIGPRNVGPDILGQTEPERINGELWLDDGQGQKFGLKAENGTVGLGPSSDSSGHVGLVLQPDEGVFSVVDGDGNPVFRVDTRNESVEIADGYSQGDM
ncbi:MAG: hypothetical protein GVY12_11145 [Bacteroidetes bacterium]|jgi:hypothetical protein|nr:hypothetical protein [Bacteroidota bacterium]